MLTNKFKVEVVKELLGTPGLLDITQLVKGISWGNSISQVSGTLTIDFLDTIDGENMFMSLPPGSQIILSNEKDELIRGIVVKTTRSSGESLSMNIMDSMFYLTKNMTSIICNEMSVSDVIKSVLEQFEIPFDGLPELTVKVKEIYRDVTLWSIIDAVLKKESDQTGIKYFARWTSGIVEFIKRDESRPLWTVDSENARISGSSSQSMEKLYNKFIIKGKDDQVLMTYSDVESAKKYGQLTYQVTDEEADDQKAQTMVPILNDQLNSLDETFAIECFGNEKVKSGDRIKIEDKMLQTFGTFEVMSVSHNVSNSLHKMNLQLRRSEYEG